MNSPQESWNLQITWSGYEGVIDSPSHASASDSDGSSECNGDLLSLFEEPEPSHSRFSRFDRGGRPFPYTRSKTRWRKRPNDEIKYLRDQVAELEELRASLICSTSKPRQLKRKINGEDETRRLKAAQTENQKLRAMVASRCQVAKALQDAIDDDMRLRAQKVYCSDGSALSNELIFV
ncbi:hypothetical protein P3T76_011210 [Phytophthora citrophthora]|uniref:BZIP domain-containing protein n=1 Tax=Phytophthora citrophthora TaxID=4793 RepID=A0AAD9G9Z3_9STRA|nr:hypothetical protein P3T76_011210 [Phytophthora citrophthora]